MHATPIQVRASLIQAFRHSGESEKENLMRIIAKLILLLSVLAAVPAFAQNPPPPPTRTPAELDQMVSRIALYPDSLVAQILAAATYPDQIPDAAKWADEHHYLTGKALADAIQGDHLPWDPSVQALLPFPSVLEMMASDMRWTTDLGNAFLAQPQDVMDATQRERRKARDFGYLRTNGQIVVGGGPYITIMPANPAFLVVPAARLRCGRRHPLWFWSDARRVLPALGLGPRFLWPL
jgi:uncharacterized protein DUF3300